MGRCEPRANENDPGLITLPEGIDELSDAVEQEFDLTLLIVETRGFSVLRGLPSGTDTVL